ncbi:MAG: hypothetical protein AMS19_06030 [Gemmatimonas sp. SG8_23]|nr:MAG: hypothetical protein AMS19_06030 [Gemmatimonas sp. SG8_23]
MPTSPGQLLVYGAYGYTARLLLPKLREQGVEFVVAGRDRARTEAIAREFDVPGRVFSLDRPAEIDRGLRGASTVLNAAGPFMYTTAPIIRACLRERVDYLDLSGEVEPLSQVADAGPAAREAGLMFLPAIGFDVVPSDCLAAHVAKRVPNARRLTFYVSASNLMSHGSGVTLAEHIGIPVHTRRDGRLEQMRMRMQMRWADFGSGYRPVVAVSWGDLVTAYRSTGIPNIEVYFEATAFRLAAVTINQYWGWMLRATAANEWFHRYADMLPEGPTREERAAERCTVVVEAEGPDGVARSRIETPEAYECTADTATRVIHRVMEGERQPGFQTPSTLFGPDFVLDCEDVTRVDL